MTLLPVLRLRLVKYLISKISTHLDLLSHSHIHRHLPQTTDDRQDSFSIAKQTSLSLFASIAQLNVRDWKEIATKTRIKDGKNA